MTEASPSSSDVLAAIYAALDQVNPQQEPSRRVPKSPDAVLFGERGTLDSLGLITFAAAVEDAVEERFDRRVTVMDEALLGQADGPLSSVRALAAYLARELAA